MTLRPSASASFTVDFVVNRSSDIGSPRVSGSTNFSSSGHNSGSVASTDLRPAPLTRTRPSATTPASSSAAPRPTVSGEAPEAPRDRGDPTAPELPRGGPQQQPVGTFIQHHRHLGHRIHKPLRERLPRTHDFRHSTSLRTNPANP